MCARAPWQDGRRAWERLNGWHLGHRPARSSDTLRALDDIGLVRGLLRQAEIGVVRAARQEGVAWSEIATRLGVTRETAVQRWHDLDKEANGSSASPSSAC